MIDTSTNVVVKRLAHADLVRPANGKFHASRGGSMPEALARSRCGIPPISPILCI